MALVNDQLECECRLEMSMNIINDYSSLLDAYVLDFFTESHMNKLSNSWNNLMSKIPLENFYYLINLSAKTQNIWPLSILSLRVLIHFLQLSRKTLNRDDLLQSNTSKLKSECFNHPKLKDLFLKRVKPKKRYEIVKMAALTAEIANELNVKYVVDVGSGLGHLSRMLFFGFNLNVCSIETQSQLTKGAREIDDEFKKICEKYVSQEELEKINNRKLVHLNQTIKSDLTVEEFKQNLKEAFGIKEENFKFGIIGLHPCGNLATVLLKLYSDCSQAKFINLVGCCYHKLSNSRDSDKDIGFPLSKFCAQRKISISHEAKALACHAIEMYSERLESRNYDHLKVHCYRAALEKIIAKNWPEYRKSALANVKFTPGLTFDKYCEAALKNLNFIVPNEDLASEETLKNLSSWENVVKFYSLRLMLAPLVETVILLDRKLFLVEKGIKGTIKAGFNPEISPRNQLLLSQKVS